jgi:hypothetical protein
MLMRTLMLMAKRILTLMLVLLPACCWVLGVLLCNVLLLWLLLLPLLLCALL